MDISKVENDHQSFENKANLRGEQLELLLIQQSLKVLKSEINQLLQSHRKTIPLFYHLLRTQELIEILLGRLDQDHQEISYCVSQNENVDFSGIDGRNDFFFRLLDEMLGLLDREHSIDLFADADGSISSERNSDDLKAADI